MKMKPISRRNSLLRSLCLSVAVLGSAAVVSDQSDAQNNVDFREAVRSVEPSLMTVVVSGTDNVPDANGAEANIGNNNDPAMNQNRPRIRWVDPNGWGNNQPMRGNRSSRKDTTSAAFAVGQDVLIAYVGGPAEVVSVQLGDGSVVEGTVVALDYVTGLGAVRVNDTALSGLIVSAAETEPGMPITALWHESSRNGSRHLTLDAGMVASDPIPNSSGLGATPKIDFGGSDQMPGAPIIDATGIVVGVMVPGGSGNLSCVRAAEVMRLVDVGTGENPSDLKRGLVGIQFESAGAMVNEVSTDSGAAIAGIKAGDVVERVNDTEVSSAVDVVSAVASSRAGDTLEVTVNRGGDSIVLPVTLNEHPQQRIAQTQNTLQNAFRPGGFAMQRGWRLQDGEMVPMEIDPKMFEMDQFPMDEMLQQFNFPGGGAFQFPRPNAPGLRKPIDGFQVERTEMEKSLQEMQRQLEQLNEKLDRQN